MKLKLEKDLVCFDIESTGLSVKNDRIVQLAIIKIFADGRENLVKTRLINPGIPIPKEASDVHHITDEMVKDEPYFDRVAKSLFDLIGDSDFCTFNGNRFDIPMLMEEFARAGFELDMTNRNCIDVKRIFHRMERRDLKAAYQFYCKKPLEGAHDALNDVKATVEVLESMLDYYNGIDCIDKDDTVIEKPIQNDMQLLADFTKDFDSVDFAGTIKLNSDNVPVFGFGKYQGQSVVLMLEKDKSYYDWIMTKGEFTSQTRKIITDLMIEHIKKYMS
jgi:DNA polymerase-3 subunit epsilon